MFQNYVHNSTVLQVIRDEQETGFHLSWHFDVTQHRTDCTNSTPDWKKNQARSDNSLPESLICLQKAANHIRQFQSFLFCLRCKDRWITPTTGATRYSERRIWADRQTPSLFIYLQYEKIHPNQSEFAWNNQDGRMSQTLDWKTLPLTLPWIRQTIFIGWERRKKNGGSDWLKESVVGKILHNRWRFETVEPLGKTSCLFPHLACYVCNLLT